MRSLLSNDSHFIYRLAAGCTSGQIHDTSLEGNIFCCAACAFRMCTAHTPPVAFHESETCAQYVARSDHERSERKAREKETAARLRRTQDDASAAAVKGLSVKCPGCGVNIQKSVGCDHMTCKLFHDVRYLSADRKAAVLIWDRWSQGLRFRVLLRVSCAV